MAKNQTLGEMLALKDLPLEEREQISDAIRYSAEHEGELFTEVNHEKLDENKTSMTFIRSYLPKIDKTSERYQNGLLEGVTPSAEEINEAEFSVPVIENGWYYKFTNKAVNHAWLDIKSRCSKFLGNIFKTYHDEKIADAYLSSANTVSNCDLLELKDLLRLNTILYKNGAVPFAGGFYKLKVPCEVADAMLVAYKDIITHTTQKESVVNGEIGEIAGFRVIKSRLQAFAYNSVSGTGKFVAYGLTAKGEYPVSICAYDNLADSVILTPLGGLGDDPLKQRGAIGLYVDGHGFYVFDDAICVTGTCADVSSKVSSITPAHDLNDVANVSYRSQFEAFSKAREIIPAYDFVKMNALYKTGTPATDTQNTFTLVCKKPDGSAWVFDDDASTGKLKGTVVAGDCITIADGVVTTVSGKYGFATIKVELVDNANIVTFVNVQVVNGNNGTAGPGILED